MAIPLTRNTLSILVSESGNVSKRIGFRESVLELVSDVLRLDLAHSKQKATKQNLHLLLADWFPLAWVNLRRYSSSRLLEVWFSHCLLLVSMKAL
jgi:hypothetical protein